MGLAFIGIMHGAEALTSHWNPLELNLTGLGETCRQNISQFEPVLDELAIKYNLQLTVGPEWRLVMLVATTIATVHAANSEDPRLAAAMEKLGGQQAARPTQLDGKFKDT